MENEKKRKEIWVGGVIVSIGAVVYFLNSQKGKKTIECAKDCKEKIMDGYAFAKENRKEIMTHIKLTSEQLTHTAESVKKDIITISECAKDLKENADDLVSAISDSFHSVKKILKKDDN